MSYYLATTLPLAIDAAESQVEAALKAGGFGVLTRIDIASTLKQKIDADIYPYLILGACNPALAYEALKIEDKVGTMLPCNVILQQKTAGETEVSAVDPVASMQAIDNPRLQEAAQAVRVKLQAIIASLA